MDYRIFQRAYVIFLHAYKHTGGGGVISFRKSIESTQNYFDSILRKKYTTENADLTRANQRLIKVYSHADISAWGRQRGWAF